ncbi:hypothetical protein [Cryptosporangium minutisporangium]|uniref:WD40 repeat domain-containing protein n=1 Tax=Cryptosporangium minutisporangium TaxID=113569 RepID=A0ABP6TC32_9ACTN
MLDDHDGALDDVLTRTLSRAADAAPLPPPDLYRTVTRGHARRRATLVAATAAITVFALLIGVAGWLKVTRSDPAPVTPATAEALWPDAIRTLPATLHGREYSVDAVLPDGTVVVHTVDAGAAQIRSVRGDARTWTSRLLASYPEAASPPLVTNVRASASWLVWQVDDEIWSLRWDGGQPQRIVAGLKRMLGGFSLAIDGDRIVYGPTSEGVRIIPAAGGTPTLLPGTAKYFTLHWPWLVHDGKAPHHPSGTPPTLWNVRTGERREAVFTAVTYRDTCTPVWCVAVGDDGKPPLGGGDDPITTVRVDGTDRKAWPGYRTEFLYVKPLRDRYLPLIRIERAADGNQVIDVIDLVDDRTVELGRMRNDPSALMRIGSGDGVFSWLDVDGSVKVFDPQRIR